MLLSSDLRLQPRGLTEQPSKCPRSPVLCSDTSPHTPHRPLQMHTVSRARSVSSVSIGELRRAAKKKSPQNRSIIQKMRRERRGPERTGCPLDTAGRRDGGCSITSRFHVLHWHHRGPAPPEPGHHPMRQSEGSSNYRDSR